MLKASEARKRLGVSREKLRQLILDGELEAIRIGDAVNAPYRVSEEAIADYIRRRTVRPEAVNQ